jgi:hypothetical protein
MTKPTSNRDLDAVTLNRKTGEEPFRIDHLELNTKLVGFWQWSCSNLLGNSLRGHLAEYIVGLALGCIGKVRQEWDAVDLQWEPEGGGKIRIEMKSAAYLQSWKQEKESAITFDIALKRPWNSETNVMETDIVRSADVYVFSLLQHRDKSNVDPMDLAQWTFFAVPTLQIHAKFGTQKSISLGPLTDLHGPPFGFAELKARVAQAAKWNSSHLFKSTNEDVVAIPRPSNE